MNHLLAMGVFAGTYALTAIGLNRIRGLAGSVAVGAGA